MSDERDPRTGPVEVVPTRGKWTMLQVVGIVAGGVMIPMVTFFLGLGMGLSA